MTDVYSRKKRSWVMSRIRSKGTGIERIMEDRFKELGLQFETHASDLPGRPDFVFRQKKVVVFLDSEFWHGYRKGPKGLARYSTFWRDKIRRNKARDVEVNKQLRRLGWTVMRFWGKEVTNASEDCARRVLHEVGGGRRPTHKKASLATATEISFRK